MSVASLKEIFDDQSEISLSGTNLKVKEIDNQNNGGKLKEVIITNISNMDLCSYKLDCHNPISKHISKSNTTGINRGVDAVVLLEIEEHQKHIFFIELKSFKVKENDVANKFFASTSFIHFVNRLMEKFYDENFSSYSASAILLSLKNSNNRLAKFGMRPDIPTFESKNYTNSKGKKIQVLEIKKNNASNFQISINDIIDNCRPKAFKNWP